MPQPSLAPQRAIARSLTHTNNTITSPDSASHCRRIHPRPRLAVGRRLHRLMVILLLLLLLLPGTIGAEGLAQDLPPVHLTAASGDAVAARVDLGDPSTFPFSSTGKWTGYLEFLGKPGTARTLGQPDLFLPLLQDPNDLTFFNLRGQLQFDNTDVHEYNIGLGHRHMFQDWILGGYGYYDQRHTQFGSAYSQFTGGLEAMSVDWGLRLNGYLPENKTETIMSGANAQVIRPGDQIKVQIDGIVQEKALPGVDGEVGYLLPIPWRAYTAVFDETRVYAGGYHFFGEDQFESVTGPRGRVEWRAYDLPVLGPGSRFMMGVEAQWDEPRGSQAFGLASLRIPFDVFSDKSTRKALTGLNRRMLQPVIRDVDVVTSERNITEITAALNMAGRAYTKLEEVELTGDQAADEALLQKAVDDNMDETVLIVPKNVETVSLLVPIDLYTNQTLAGKEGTVGYESQWLGSGSIGHGVAGAATGFLASDGFDGNRLIVMAPDSEVNGLTLDANGNSATGLQVNTDAGHPAGTRYVANSTITNATKRGVFARGSDAEFRIDNSRISGGLEQGVSVWYGATVHISNSHIYDNRGQGVLAQYDAHLTVSDSHIYDNDTDGIEVQNGSTATISKSYIYDNDVDGVAGTTGSMVNIFDSYIYDNDDDGIRVTSGATLTIMDSIITENERDGVHTNIGDNLLGGHVTIKRSSITNNGRYGVASRYGSTVIIEDSRITGNGYYGLLAESWAGDVLPVDGSTTDLTGLSGPEGLQDPRSILKATNVIVSGNGWAKEGGGYGVLNRGGTITLNGSKVFDNTGGNYRNEAGFFRQDAPEFIDFGGERGWDYDACLRHDGSITVDGQSLGPPIVLPSPVENDPDRTCTVWPSP